MSSAVCSTPVWKLEDAVRRSPEAQAEKSIRLRAVNSSNQLWSALTRQSSSKSSSVKPQIVWHNCVELAVDVVVVYGTSMELMFRRRRSILLQIPKFNELGHQIMPRL
jgi:hypothetical protein